MSISRVLVSEAKVVLDELLQRYSKSAIARMSGLSYETLHHIDHLKVARVDRSTLDMLRRVTNKENFS